MQRLHTKKQMHATVIGVAWYSDEESWREIRSSATDAELLEASYVEWVAMANEAFKEIEASGAAVIRHPLVPSAFLAWCHALGKENNAASRSEFVAQTVQSTCASGAQPAA